MRCMGAPFRVPTSRNFNRTPRVLSADTSSIQKYEHNSGSKGLSSEELSESCGFRRTRRRSKRGRLLHLTGVADDYGPQIRSYDVVQHREDLIVEGEYDACEGGKDGRG